VIRLPVRQFDFAGEHSRGIESNREVPQTNRLSLLSRFKNEEGSYDHFLIGLSVMWYVSTPCESSRIRRQVPQTNRLKFVVKL